ncbi:hypothetical protein LEMLEM_LOCUS1883 [Lemmus lemmus]
MSVELEAGIKRRACEGRIDLRICLIHWTRARQEGGATAKVLLQSCRIFPS